jgi:hypothetical protein
MSEYGWPAPPPANVVYLRRICDYPRCGGYIERDDPCVELFDGVLGQSKKSGQPMVVDAGTTPEKSVVLHPQCVIPYARDCIDAAEDPEQPECPICSSMMDWEECNYCGSQIMPGHCPHCGLNIDEYSANLADDDDR